MVDSETPSQGMPQRKYLHVEVYEKLYQMIKEEGYQEGDQLPGENHLAAQFGVSRMTLRQALMLLGEDGIVRRVHGKGNFITSIRPRSSIGAEGVSNPVQSFSRIFIDDIKLDIRFEAASEYVIELFGYQKSTVMMASDRWYRASSRLVAFCFSFTDLEKMEEHGVDIADHAAILEFMDTTIYTLCPHSTTHITLSTRKEFSLTPEQMTAPSLILLSETLFTDDGKPIAQNKYYLDPAYFDIIVNARRIPNV
jgi:DNA-binding GntR family transcriptional regulator